MSMMVEDKCGAKTWTLVNGKWKEHSCIKRRPVNDSTHLEQISIGSNMTMKRLHKCDDGYKWPTDELEEQPWKNNLPSHEDVLKQMQDLIGV